MSKKDHNKSGGPTLDDQTRFQRILDIFPENFIDEFINDELWNARYPRRINKKIDDYSNRKNEILFQFSNQKINKAYKDLNNAFDKLIIFLQNHFDIPKREDYEQSLFYYLKPSIHHNFRRAYGKNEGDVQADAEEWRKLKQQLDEISKKFEDAYKKFVEVGKTELEKGDRSKGGNEEGVFIAANKMDFDGKIISDTSTKIFTNEYTGSGKIINKTKEDISELWHKSWWGKIIVGVTIFIIARLLIFLI